MRYLIKKIITMLITLIALSFVVFFAFKLIPGDSATSMLGTQATPERIQALREEMGLNDPVIIQYFRWAGGFVAGDMGTSYSYRMPVSDMIIDKIPITIALTVMAFIIVLMISMPLGIYTAKYKGSLIDRVINVINQLIMAVPPFFIGILFTYLFGLLLKLFTPGGYISYKDNFGGFMKYLIFPAIAVALPKAAMSVKLLRTSVIEETRLDYVRTAYSRGNSTNGVLYGHVLKNALIPVITFWGMAFTDMMTGSIIIEQVFNIPGLGRMLLTSIANRDYPVVMAVIMFFAFSVLLTNLLVDLLYPFIDPRISRQ